jgi:hypothetical protein|tara:strand:+ start:136 stop:378 length:243 start_codon:yes stop_codon:yes gene_type:complete
MEGIYNPIGGFMINDAIIRNSGRFIQHLLYVFILALMLGCTIKPAAYLSVPPSLEAGAIKVRIPSEYKDKKTFMIICDVI